MILVTGGAGYVGSHFVRRYCALNPEGQVIVVDNLSEGQEEALAGLSSVVFKQEDIGNYDAMKELFSKYAVDCVVHFAANAYISESQRNPNKYFHNNVINTLTLFRAMEECNVRKIVFSSTCATYGNPQYLPIDEKHPQDPINIYGLTKMIVEKVLAGYADTCGWSYIALRYFNACGADESGMIGESHDPETHIIPLALMVASGRLEAVEIYGGDYDSPDGTCIRDYVHVTDLANAHLQAMKLLKNQKGGDVINLGATCGASVKEIINICEEVTGSKIPYRIAPRREGDPSCLVADAKKAGVKLQWKPTYDLKRAIETAWHWEKNRQFQYLVPAGDLYVDFFNNANTAEGSPV
jgi:UDP-glucose 4-epimerase